MSGSLERGDGGEGLGVVGPHLDGEGALGRRGQHLDRVEDLGGLADPGQPAQPGGGEDDGVEPSLADRPDPGVDVPAQVHELDAETERGDLGAAARGAGADPSAGRQLGQGQAVAGDEGVAGVLAARDRGHRRARVGRGGQVLVGVHGEVDPALGQGLAEGGDEHPGASERGERGRPVAVALGAHLDQHDVDAEVTQAVGDPGGLGRREGGAAGAQAQRGHRSSPGICGGTDTSETSAGSRSNSSERARA